MKNKVSIIVAVSAVLLILIVGIVHIDRRQKAPSFFVYRPQINPSDFSISITNNYFSLPVGKKFVYEGQTADGLERVEITIPGDTREIMGAQTLVYRDIVTLNGLLVEDTRDYLAQDKEGNVWYFGEEVDNFENGILKDHAGSWIAGLDGAQPGIWMKARPQVGETYRQEYYQGQAEDMADVVSLSETVTTKKATYQNCLKTYDYTPLDPGAREHKYYCPEVGGLALEVNLTDGGLVELVEVTTDPSIVERQVMKNIKTVDCGTFENCGVRFVCPGNWKIQSIDSGNSKDISFMTQDNAYFVEGSEVPIIFLHIENDVYGGSIQGLVDVQNASVSEYEVTDLASMIGWRKAYRLSCRTGQMYCESLDVVFANGQVYQFLNRANQIGDAHYSSEEGDKTRVSLNASYDDLISSVTFYKI